MLQAQHLPPPQAHLPIPSHRESRLCPLTPVHNEEGSQGQGDHPQTEGHADPGLMWARLVKPGPGEGWEPVYSADPSPYLIWGQMERPGVAPWVNLCTLASGKGFLYAEMLSWDWVGLWLLGWQIFKLRKSLDSSQSWCQSEGWSKREREIGSRKRKTEKPSQKRETRQIRKKEKKATGRWKEAERRGWNASTNQFCDLRKAFKTWASVYPCTKWEWWF